MSTLPKVKPTVFGSPEAPIRKCCDLYIRNHNMVQISHWSPRTSKGSLRETRTGAGIVCELRADHNLGGRCRWASC